MIHKPNILLWLKRIVALVVTIPVVGVCLLVGSIPASGAIMSGMAFALRPTAYPNSELVATNDSGGPDGLWFRQTYKTADGIDAVVTCLSFYDHEKWETRRG